MSTIDRPSPPCNAGERTTLEGWLDFHRATLAMKCEGLDDEQATAASVPPSAVTLAGLVQHMAEVERNWRSRPRHRRQTAVTSRQGEHGLMRR